MTFKCGFIAVVGRPNVGKSTLVNALCGNKVSIVTNKPQTTRHRILAIVTEDDYQAIYVDTPGLHRKAGKAMNRMMNRAASNALADADLVLFLTEAWKWTAEDADVLKRLKHVQCPVIAVMNKVDNVNPRNRLLGLITEMSERSSFTEIVPISARRAADVERIAALVPSFLPESPAMFPEDAVSDRGDAFRAAELIREQLMLELHHEVPYGLTVEIEKMQAADRGIEIQAIVWVERESQKGIVVGKQGRVLKQVGREARLQLKADLGQPVHLTLWAKVKQNWADNEKDLTSLGYDLP